MADVGNLDTLLEGYFILYFIMAKVSNLDTYLDITFVYFYNYKGGTLIEKIADPMAEVGNVSNFCENA